MEKDVSSEPGEVKVTVTLFLNASFSWLEKPNKNFISYHLVTCFLLAGMALAAIVINLCLLSAIFCNSNLKRVVLNQFVSVVSIACVLDCSINVPFALFHMRTTDRVLGDSVCKANASCVILINLMITWGMSGVCFERWFSIFKRNRIKVNKIYKQTVAMAIPILMGIVVLIPIAMEYIEVRIFPDRYSCSVAIRKDQSYRVIILIVFLIPVVFGMIALISSLIKNYRSIRNVNSQSVELSYAELFFEESHLWNEWQSSKFVACITLLYLFLELPYIVNQIEPVTSLNKSPLLNHLTKTNSTAPVPLQLTQITSTIDRAYTWCKFVFCLLFPLTTLALRKDIRRKISSLLSFCRTNSSISSKVAEEGSSTQGDNPDDFLVPQVWRRRRLSSVTSLTAPIVFGRARVGSVQHQLVDLSTGMARWKASYEETKRKAQPDKTLFDDVFEDDDEFTEYSRYEDGTEEEINSSEDFKCAVKEVAVQTNDKTFESSSSYFPLPKPSPNCPTLGQKVYKNRNRRLSKSFTSNRTNNAMFIKRNNYLTYPKLPSSSKNRSNLQASVTTSELLKILKAYRSKKSVTACDILPRSTGELMDCTLDEGKDIVSL